MVVLVENASDPDASHQVDVAATASMYWNDHSLVPTPPGVVKGPANEHTIENPRNNQPGSDGSGK